MAAQNESIDALCLCSLANDCYVLIAKASDLCFVAKLHKLLFLQ